LSNWRDGDKTLLWGLSGLISTVIFSDAYSVALKLLGAEPQYSWNFAADYIIQGRQNIESFYGVVIGLVTWLKGIGVALSNWIGLGIMTQVVSQLFTYKLAPLNYFTYIFSYILFGILTSWLIVKFLRHHINILQLTVILGTYSK
jgi:hypothetical protein